MTELKTRFFRLVFVTALAMAQSELSIMGAAAADWGYDDPGKKGGGESKVTTPEEYDDMKRQPSPHVDPGKTAKVTSAHSAKSKDANPAKSKVATSFLQPDVIDVDHAMKLKQAKVESLKQRQLDKQHRLAGEWLELYSLVATEPLTDEQRKRFEERLVKAAAQGSPDFESIDKFWPQVKKVCLSNPEQQANYRDLLRALFRLEMRQQKVNPVESELVGELIGPERVAVPDKPPLTEDAVEAYADMTCFIYNQTHPGKTVDALDNRTVFVATIEKRYMHSESPLEKLAMSNFALKWGKFKVLYADADDADKEKLFKRISGTSLESLRKDIVNPPMDALMNNGPWVHALTAANDPAPIKP